MRIKNSLKNRIYDICSHSAVTLILISVLLFSLVACGKNRNIAVYTYELDDSGNAVITGLTENGATYSSLTIPSSIDGKTVTTIAAEAFRGNSIITKVTVSSGITEIRENAFFACSNLSSIEIPDTVEKIGSNAFTSTAWLNEELNKSDIVVAGNVLCASRNAKGDIKIADNVKSISSGAFYNNKDISSVTLPAGLISIDSYAFAGCSSLTNITLPEGLKSIGYGAFSDTGIKSITVPASVEEIGNEAFSGIAEVIKKN